jgi:hypothetical protein
VTADDEAREALVGDGIDDVAHHTHDIEAILHARAHTHRDRSNTIAIAQHTKIGSVSSTLCANERDGS